MLLAFVFSLAAVAATAVAAFFPPCLPLVPHSRSLSLDVATEGAKYHTSPDERGIRNLLRECVDIV